MDDCIICRKAGLPAMITVTLCQDHLFDALLSERTESDLAAAIHEALQRHRASLSDTDRPN